MARGGAQRPPASSSPETAPSGVRFEDIPAIKLLATTWAALVREEKSRAADEVERTGKEAHGDETFGEAMASAVGSVKGNLGDCSGFV
ncbi:hypothetical protein B0A55_09729 [Friedmanniomyces simplex]|uniref:Uncharacterized protein n=1 Tax=Friedmanniomyces simplex TaxID=329884 RepID=A0A4U0WPS0_9PEZI|nr:hypothetical protein B0A55_09729 [Friedmanniomyces simplex]